MSQVMDFIKAHTLALTCGVIALLAMIAFFIYPIPGMFSDLQAEVDKSKTTHDSLLAVKDASRTLPPVDLVGEAKPLNAIFPTRNVIAQGQDALKRLKEQADAAVIEANRINQRPLLVVDSLPKPTSVKRQSFFDAYKRVTAQTGDGAEEGIIRKVLLGSLPPTADELKAQGDARANEIYAKQLQLDAERKPVNQPEVDALVAAMRAKLPGELRMNRALQSKVYVSPTAVDVHPAAKATELPDASTIFNAQFSLWLQTIAFEALADANKNAANVLDAPVKHLVKLDVEMEAARITGGPGAGAIGFGGDPTAAPAAPTELTPDPSAAITPVYTDSPLGHGHNSLYDTFPVRMTLRVDIRQLPQILATLGRERLLKVRNVANLRPVELGKALNEGYVYDKTGTTPMVEVQLDCEVLMLRPWLVPLMPDPVKTYFASLSNGPAVAAP